MRIYNNVQQNSFRGAFNANKQLVPVLKGASELDKIVFSKILKDIQKINDDKVFEIGMKKSCIGLSCLGLGAEPLFIQLSDKIFKKDSSADFYKGILKKINVELRKFYPKEYGGTSDEQEIVSSKDKFPFYLEDRFETEVVEPEKNTLNIHEDLLPFEAQFRDEELFDYKQDLLESYHGLYDKNDLELAHNLKPISDSIEYYNNVNKVYDYGELLSTKINIKKPKAKELPKEFPHFALDYVREFSVSEARALYDFLKKIAMDDYDSFIKKHRSLFKNGNVKFILECMSDAVLNPLRSNKRSYSPKLFRFIYKHPFERSLVVSTDYAGIEHFDESGAEFYEELSKRCADKQAVKDIYNSCKIWVSGGREIINWNRAHKLLLDYGYYFSSGDKEDVVNAISKTCSEAQIEEICNNIQENKVENCVDYAKSIASDLGDYNLKESINRAQRALVKYTNKSGETIGVFKEALKEILAINPECRDIVVSKSSKGDEVFEEQKIRLYKQIQKIFGDTEEAKILYSSCQSVVKSGLTEGATAVNEKGKVLSKLLDKDFTYKEALKVYECIVDSKVSNGAELTDMCIKYRKEFGFNKLLKLIQDSIVKVNPEKGRIVFDDELMKFLVKYPDDRDLVIIKGLNDCEKFDWRQAKHISHLRHQEEMSTLRNTYYDYTYSTRNTRKTLNESMRDLKVRIQDLDRRVQELDKAMHKPVEQNGQKKVEVFHSYEEFLEEHGEIKQNESMSMEIVNGVIKKITITSD